MKTKHAHKFHYLLVLALAFLAVTFFSQSPAQAASVNSKAHSAYKAKMKTIMTSGDVYCINYSFMDVNNDNVDECIMCYHDLNNGSSSTFRIYRYKSGSLKLMVNDFKYGVVSVTYYKSSKSFVLHMAGHGGETYDYYKPSSGKFKFKARKSREAICGGGAKNGSWYYYNSTPAGITRSQFMSRVKGIRKGSKQVTTLKHVYQ